jgi:Holliday junction DNA helicase RuvA
MIGHLKGNVIHRQAEWLILDVQGVGYEIYPTHVDEVSVGQNAAFWVYTSVREDAIQLYGFESIQERDVFTALLKVSGIGPKLASKILSSCPWTKLLELIEMGDASALTSIPKVGRKTAEQIIVELKGKSLSLPSVADGSASTGFGSVRAQIVSALVNLGYRPADVEKVIRIIPADTTLEQGVREGLQKLSQL